MARLWRRTGSHRETEDISGHAEFARFYERTYPSLLRYLVHLTGDGHLAIELTAEAYAKAFEKRHRFRGSTREEAIGWVWAIARNEVRMHWRGRAVELAAIERLQLPRPAPDDAELARIDDLLTAERDAAPVIGALHELPKDQQDVIRMHVIDELEHSEIAAILGVSADVVRARVSRGLRRLAALAKRGW